MRAILLLLATVLLGPHAAAQEVIALAINGWQQQTGADGVVKYRCASPICAAGSVVSYKAQPHRTGITLKEFEAHHRGLAQHYSGTGSMRSVSVGDPKERTIEGVRVLQVIRQVMWTSGTITHSIEARLIGPNRSYSLVSNSPKPQWTANNFDGFLRRMVDIAGIRGN